MYYKVINIEEKISDDLLKAIINKKLAKIIELLEFN